MSAEAARPRRRDAARTRRAILAAAQTAFAAKGYAQAGVREIAAAAGVDPALVRRYFGSKEGLFKAALSDALDIGDLVDTSRERFGVHLAAYLLDDGGERPNPLPMMIMAMADPHIREIALDLLHHRVMSPLATWIGAREAEPRAARVSMICSGFVAYTRLMPLKVFADGVDPATRAWLEQSLQAAVDD
ncbi:MAG: TetR family transcriptional regulator [Caulobacteraceae bacterium]|nr:TetR family transcriptional regulator [Caulobacteraceae bacterium]